MKRLLLAVGMLICAAVAVAELNPVGPPLPVRADGFLLVPVDDALARRIADAQDGKGVPFTIAIDGGKAEPLDVSPERLRDYQNVYYRVILKQNAWHLEEAGFSPTGEDEESRIIRRALGVPEVRRIFFLPGREHLLVPAGSRVVLRAGEEVWNFRAGEEETRLRKPRRAVLIRAGQPISLALTETLSTAAARKGAIVTLTVAENVAAEGLTAIVRGSPVRARILNVQRAGFGGNPGMLVLALESAQAVDDTEIPLRGSMDNRVAFVGRAGCPLFRGREVVLPAGASFTVRAARTTAVLAPTD